MEIKLKSGKKLKLKDVSIDERDEMMDSIEWEMNGDGTPGAVKMMHTTMTKWMRLGLDGDISDKLLKTLTFEDKVEVFSKMQTEFMSSGEGKPSNSK